MIEVSIHILQKSSKLISYFVLLVRVQYHALSVVSQVVKTQNTYYKILSLFFLGVYQWLDGLLWEQEVGGSSPPS